MAPGSAWRLLNESSRRLVGSMSYSLYLWDGSAVEIVNNLHSSTLQQHPWLRFAAMMAVGAQAAAKAGGDDAAAQDRTVRHARHLRISATSRSSDTAARMDAVAIVRASAA